MASESASVTTEASISASGLIRMYGARAALDHLDLEVGRGESVALFGPNGAGKTTLIRILTLGLRASGGSFSICGLHPRRDDLQIRRRIGLVSHESFLYDDLTAEENLIFFARLYGLADPLARATKLLDAFGLARRAADPVRAYSRGMRQRASLARALVHDPELVFLDEPFSGLDPHAARILQQRLERLRGNRRTILLVTHDLGSGLALSDRWIVLRRGRVAAEGRSSQTDPIEFERWYHEQFAEPDAQRRTE